MQRYLPLAPRDLLILSVLAEGPLHGYGIIKAVEDRSRSGVLLDPANLYRALRRMKKAGWVRGVRSPAAAEPDPYPHRCPEEARDAGAARGPEGARGPDDGPLRDPEGEGRRKTYEITAPGRLLLVEELSRLERLLDYTRPALAKEKGE